MVCTGTSLQEINIQALSIRLSTALCIYIFKNLSTPTIVYTLHINHVLSSNDLPQSDIYSRIFCKYILLLDTKVQRTTDLHLSVENTKAFWKISSLPLQIISILLKYQM